MTSAPLALNSSMTLLKAMISVGQTSGGREGSPLSQGTVGGVRALVEPHHGAL